MKIQNNDNYINLEEAVEYMRIKPVTLRGWIKNITAGVIAKFLHTRLVDFKNLNILSWRNG